MAKILEIEFKGGRKTFFANPQEFPFVVGDLAVVQADNGEGLGTVINMGSLVDQRAGTGEQEFKKIVRRANKDDLARMDENLKLERDAFLDCKKRIEEHGLDMKLVDVEYQFDKKKITFYFTSDNRVDFRALVRDLAARYRTRIELRQIGVRDEAKRIGGVGVCGRRLCCTTFLRKFEPVVTQYAKDQNLALNPTKLSGGCGRLMCCLRYEQMHYAKILGEFPEPGTVIKTARGSGVIKKINVIEEVAVLEYGSEEVEKLKLEELKALMTPQGRKEKKKSKAKKKKGQNEVEPGRDNRPSEK